MTGPETMVTKKRPSWLWPVGALLVFSALILAEKLLEMYCSIGIMTAVTSTVAVIAVSIASNRSLARKITARTAELENELAERRLVEEKLRNSEGLLRTLVHTLPDLVWLKDRNGVFLSCNSMFERLFGAGEADILGKTDYDFVDRDLADFFTMNDRKAIAAGKPSSNEEWITFADDGRRALFETIKTPVYDQAGEVIGVLGIGRDITKRKQAEVELRESEEKFRVLAETLPAGICVYQGEYIVYCNAAMTRLTGYSDRELMEMRFWEWIHEETKETVRQRALARQRGEPALAQYEMRIVTKAAEEKWLLLSAGRIEYQGKPAGIATMFDITDRKQMEDELKQAHDDLEKQVMERTADLRETNELLECEIAERRHAEESLREAEARLKMAMDLARLVQWEYDFNTGLFTFDNQFYALYGTTAEREGGSQMSAEDYACKFIPVEERSIVAQGIAQILANSSFQLEHAIIRADGEERFIVVHGEAVRDHMGCIIGIRGANQDITERKRAEEELRLTQFCVDKSSIAIYHVTEKGEIWNVNECACRSLGYSMEELCSMTVLDIDPNATMEVFNDLVSKTFSCGSVTFERVHRRKDGTTFPVEITANYLEFMGRKFGICFARDITEWKKAEEALRESEFRVRRKLDRILDPEGDIGELELADILDLPQIRSVMNYIHLITGMKMSIIDLTGQVLLDVGWQDICLKFHRVHPETRRKCHKSDTELTVGIPQGKFRAYRCGNSMWHIVTPVVVGGKHMGNLFMGQFFYENEEIDYELFRSQATEYGFPKGEYMAALDAVPRYGEEYVNLAKEVFVGLTEMFSKLSYANIKLASLLAERDRLTATLRQANMVVENSPALLFRWKGDDEWPVELVSGNIVKLGYTPDEFLSGSITYSSIIHPDDLERVTREVHDFCDDGSDRFRLEYRILTKGGETRWINEHSNIERDPAGKVEYFEGIVIDITERKLFEEKLQQQQKLLKDLNECLEKRVEEEVTRNRAKDIMLIQQNRQASLGEMLDHIAHQWKQPLNSISLIVEDLRSTVSDGEHTQETVDDAADKIRTLLDHTVQIIDVFRGFYRPDKEKKIFSVKDAIDQALGFIAPALRFDGIAVEVDIDPGLTGFGFPKEFTQALLNILANARDVFRVRNTKKPRILVAAFAEGIKTVVTVEDNAGGISDAIIHKIFDFHFSTTEESGGTGIGLYMSKTIVEKNMGGYLSAENTINGARFRIEISPA